MSQIVSKFLATGAVAKLLNNTYMVGRNAANTADVNLIKVNASDKVELAAGAQVSGTPSSGNDIVNKTYADSITGTGANTALSNLASVAINTALLAGTDNTISLGSATKRWLAAFIGSIQDASSVISVDITNRLLKNSSGSTMVNFSGTDLVVTPILVPSADNTTNLGKSTTRFASAYFGTANDGSGVLALSITSRTLNNASGTTMIDFSGTNPQTSTTPSAGNDIANKTYVDSVASAQKTWGYEALTLSGTDITNQYKDLAQVAITDSIEFFVGGVWQRPVTDYTISYTGGAGGKTRLTFAGDLATGGAAALVSTDVINIRYQY